MGDETGISWTDRTFNPWWGCVAISPACDNCYAERDAHRWDFDVWGKDADRRHLSDANWRKPLKWEREAIELGRPLLVFCASMADVFEARDDLDPLRARLWELIEATPHLIWQLLTKRPEQVTRRVPEAWMKGEWPEHVWIGTTVENQHYADLRIPRLTAIPAPVRFLSCEPIVGPINLAGWWGNGIQWVIAGGESGPGWRPMDLDHARLLRDQAAEAGVPYFFKQVGGFHGKDGGDLLDGERHHAFPPEAGQRDETPVTIGEEFYASDADERAAERYDRDEDYLREQAAIEGPG